MGHSAERDGAEGQGMYCGVQYGSNPDRCYLQSNHRGAHSNRWGTTWANDDRLTPPAEPGADRG